MSSQSSNQNYGEMLNSLIDDLKNLRLALEYLENFEAKKDLSAMDLALDSILLRVRKISLRIADNHQMAFPLNELEKLIESKEFEGKILKKYGSKEVKQILDFPIESLRKFALSEILRSSIPG